MDLLGGQAVLSREALLRLGASDLSRLVELTLELQDRVCLLQWEIPGLKQELAYLHQELAKVNARLEQDSHNSHQPPSSDGYAKPAPKSLREKSGRPPGGQSGHPGHTLEPVAHPDHTVVHPLTHCPHGHPLADQPVLGHEKRQVFDLPIQSLEAVEHQAEVKRCPFCQEPTTAPFPTDVEAPVQYGGRFLALLVYWRDVQLIPLDRIRQMTDDLFHQRVSKATVEHAVQRATEKLRPFQEALSIPLQNAPQLHADETGLRVNGQMHWLHVLSNSQWTWYGVHRKRGTDAMEDFSILPNYRGRLVHDELGAYWRYATEHVLCNAHHRRELIFADEQERQRWARDLQRLLQRAHARRLRQGSLTPRQKQTSRARYRLILAAADPPEKSKAHSLRRRLIKYETETLAFLEDPAIPFTNNQAEQDLRMMKVQQKISGSFRTFDGARLFAALRSYISTLRKQGLSIWDGLTDALRGRPFLPATT